MTTGIFTMNGEQTQSETNITDARQSRKFLPVEYVIRWIFVTGAKD